MKQTVISSSISELFNSPLLGESAKEVISAWRAAIKLGLPDKITHMFGGETLESVFGPVGSRTPIQLLDADDYKRKMDAIKKFTNPNLYCIKGNLVLESLGEVELITALELVLNAFTQIRDPETNNPVLWGLQLRTFDKNESVMSGIPVNIKYLKTNMKAQRTISLTRLFRLMCNFDSSLVFGAKGRFSSKELKVYLNDGNHGTLACILHGVLTPPVGFSVKESPWIDNNQFIACGLDVLPLTHYDLHKNQVNRAILMKEYGHEIKPEDLASYNLHKVLTNCGITLVPEAVTNPNPRHCNQTAHMKRHFSNYCKDEYENRKLFETALRTVAFAWPGSAVDHAPVWGLIEFYRCQPIKSLTDNLVISVAEVLREKWASPNVVWPEVNKQIQAQYPKSTKKVKNTMWKDHRFTSTNNRGLMIAAAILTLINNREAWIRNQPGRNKGFDLKLNQITDIHGQLFEMDMPYISKHCTQNFSTFVPTEHLYKADEIGDTDTSNEAELSRQIDEFENAI